MNLLDALRHGATFSCHDEDEDRAREAGSLIDAVRNLLASKRIGTIEELRKALGSKVPKEERS